MRFMKTDAFQVNDITVNLIDDPENYLPFQDIFVSFTTKTYSKSIFGGSTCISQRKFEICY